MDRANVIHVATSSLLAHADAHGFQDKKKQKNGNRVWSCRSDTHATGPFLQYLQIPQKARHLPNGRPGNYVVPVSAAVGVGTEIGGPPLKTRIHPINGRFTTFEFPIYHI